MTAVASSIKSIWPFLPVDRFLCFISWKVSNATRCGIEPFFLIDIIGYRKCLQAPFFNSCKKIVDILPSHDVFDLIFLLSLGTCFYNISGLASNISMVFVFADYDFVFMRGKFCFCKFGSIRLHCKSVERRRPEGIKFFVTFPAARGNGTTWVFLIFLYILYRHIFSKRNIERSDKKNKNAEKYEKFFHP